MLNFSTDKVNFLLGTWPLVLWSLSLDCRGGTSPPSKDLIKKGLRYFLLQTLYTVSPCKDQEGIGRGGRKKGAKTSGG